MEKVSIQKLLNVKFIDSFNEDGIITSIYEHFWMASNALNDQSIIHLPDTIIFKFGRPYVWYFTSNNGKVKKKKKEHLKA